MGVDPIDIREWPAAQVMIDTDQKSGLQTLESGALNAVAFEDDRSLVIAIYPIGLHHAIGKRQPLVDARNRIIEHDIGFFAKAAKNFTTSKSGPDGIAIWAGMRSEHEAVPLFDVIENFPQHNAMLAAPPRAGSASWSGSRVRRSVLRIPENGPE
jgi:hypothetical protein